MQYIPSAESVSTPLLKSSLAWRTGLALAWLITMLAPCAAMERQNVLLVYNNADEDSMVIRKKYLEYRPGIEEFDLNNPAMKGRHTLTNEEFRDWIRQPLRKHLALSEDLSDRIICIVLTKGIPHRIDDNNQFGCGDDAARTRTEWLSRGDFTAASVDSELTLLWHDLGKGEAGGSFDSRADGFVANPYLGATKPIARYSRAFIKAAKSLDEKITAGGDANGPQAGWGSGGAKLPVARLDPGSIYLVARLDGPTVGAVTAMIERTARLRMQRTSGLILLDGNDDAGLDKGDYARAAKLLSEGGWQVRLDETPDFVVAGEESRSLLAYAGYGLNDSSEDTPKDGDYIAAFGFRPGAVFNTLESFNGRDFGGAGDRPTRPQTQLANFIAAGGSFGIGNVWEPFTFSSPRNEYLLDRFFNKGWTWIEAAYASLPALSWQQIVVGDPLARIVVDAGEEQPQPDAETPP